MAIGRHPVNVTEPPELRNLAAANRERIIALEHELTRVRNRQHEMAEQLAVIHYLGEQVRELADDVKDLTRSMTTVARQAVHRPSPAGWSAVAAWISIAVAIVALIVAGWRG